jgi:flagellar assembly protein FliH
MVAAPAKKFLFDHDFAVAPDGKPSSVALAEHAQKLTEAEATGYQRGFAQAQAEARADAEQRAAGALERIAAGLTALDQSLAAVETKLETEAVEVAVAVARKLAPELIAREPLAELSALAKDCFRHLVATPHVVVRVSDALHGTAREKLDEIVRVGGLDSRLVVLAEPDIAPGDCRIEWADGGITRDSAATQAAIEEAVTRYVDARRGVTTLPKVSWSTNR